MFLIILCMYVRVCGSGLESDESYEGVSEASFKDAIVFEGTQEDSDGPLQENGVRQRRWDGAHVCFLSFTFLHGTLCVYINAHVFLAFTGLPCQRLCFLGITSVCGGF